MIRQNLRRAVLGGAIGFIFGISPFSLAAGLPSSPTERSSAGDPKPQQPAAASNLRARTNKALSTAFPATSGERRTQAEKLVSLYTEIGEAKQLAGAERSRLQARLKSRLSRLADAIALDVKRERAAGQTQAGSGSAGDTSATSLEASQTASAGSNGGAPQDDGQALVELIQATIAPQSWDVNGGPGTIVYWPAWHVLVVRQTDDVHEQIGGAMHAMRK
jgi:hypothetical protein